MGDTTAATIMSQGLDLQFHTPPPLSYHPPACAMSSEAQVPCLRTFLPKLLARKIVRGPNSAPSAPLLLQTLPGLQEGRNIPPCPRPLSAEQIPGCPSLQDGVHPVNCFGHSGALMGFRVARNLLNLLKGQNKTF